MLEFLKEFGFAGLIALILFYDRKMLLSVLRSTDQSLREINKILAVIKDRIDLEMINKDEYEP